MANYNDVVGKKPKKQTPQSKPIPGMKKKMEENNAGGYTFKVGKMNRLRRFLILGAMEGTYYVSAKDHIKDNYEVLKKIATGKKAKEAIELIVDVSVRGLAKQNDHALFALAVFLTEGDNEVKDYAINAVYQVARIGTHILQLADYLDNLRGWGRVAKRAINTWYEGKDVDSLAFQMLKYRNRAGWTQRDLLRTVHPKTDDVKKNQLFGYVTSGKECDLKIVEGFEKAKAAESVKELIPIIEEYNLPREMVPTEYLNKPKVQEAMLPNLGITALMRNLGGMTASGMLDQGSFENLKYVIGKLTDEEVIKKGRVHPISVLYAIKTYAQGHGEKGSLTWSPIPRIIAALDDMFYKTFEYIKPTGNTVHIGLDISGSMAGNMWGGGKGILSPREITACMAMVTMRTEQNWVIGGFSHKYIDLGLHQHLHLPDVIKKISGLPFGSTDCALPMIVSEQKGWDIDTHIIYTDNETYIGDIHPMQALKRYREKKNPESQLIVCTTDATNFSIADKDDPGCLDISGFSPDVPNVIAQFMRGEI